MIKGHFLLTICTACSDKCSAVGAFSTNLYVAPKIDEWHKFKLNILETSMYEVFM